MAQRSTRVQPLLCALGLHLVPPPRDPNGPVVAFCACCRQAMYCYGIENSAWNIYPNLMLPNFPRVLGPAPSVQGTIMQTTPGGLRVGLLPGSRPSYL